MILLACLAYVPFYYQMTSEQEADVKQYIDMYVEGMQENERQMWLQDVMADFEERDKYLQFELYKVEHNLE